MKTIPLILSIFLVAYLSRVEAFTLPEVSDSTSHQIKLEKGIEAFYKTDWDQAALIFNELQSQAPKDSRAYFSIP